MFWGRHYLSSLCSSVAIFTAIQTIFMVINRFVFLPVSPVLPPSKIALVRLVCIWFGTFSQAIINQLELFFTLEAQAVNDLAIACYHTYTHTHTRYLIDVVFWIESNKQLQASTRLLWELWKSIIKVAIEMKYTTKSKLTQQQKGLVLWLKRGGRGRGRGRGCTQFRAYYIRITYYTTRVTLPRYATRFGYYILYAKGKQKSFLSI